MIGAPMAPSPVVLDGGPLTLAHVQRVAVDRASVETGAVARAALARSREAMTDLLARGGRYYGVNTGFGSLSRTRIPEGDLRQLQVNLVRSHAAGVGPPLSEPVVRGMLLLLAGSLCRGASGVRPEVVEAIVGLLNAGVTPVVPEVGSVGASGDLAPLAHAALVLLGEGEALHAGERLSGGEALQRAGLSPITLEAKEGLALLNGTHLMAAQGALLCARFERTFDAALAACAASIDAAKATDAFLDARVYELRNQSGPDEVAAWLRALLSGSEILESHRAEDARVQDPYSFRCAALVLGSAWDCARYVKQAVEAELGAVTDNPLVLTGEDGPEPAIVSAGNFHGMPMAIPLDALVIACAHVAGISERRTFWILAAREPEAELPAYLAKRPGLESGLMITQYTAAACCNEIIGLCAPASVSNIPTSAGIEDYNSFGPRAASKAMRAMDLLQRVVAIELLCAAEGVEMHRPLRSGEGVERAIASVRAVAPERATDTPPTPAIEAVAARIEGGDLSG